MLSKDALEAFAQKYQTSTQNVIREYFQHVFLSLFYEEEIVSNIYFKGGTALRLLYGSQRFSEDLDFDSPLPDITAIEHAVIAVLAKTEKDGIVTELDEAKETTGGYLAVMRFSGLGYVVPIRIEISFRETQKRGRPTIVTSDIFPDYSVIQLVQEQLVEGKISALLSRKKPRDFYDFYFLLRHNMIPIERKKELLRDVLDVLDKTNISFEKELKEFLVKSHHMIIRDFKQTLEREVKRYI